MSDVILKLLIDTTVKSSLIIIVILLIKQLLKERSFIKFNYYIWYILLVKLIVPFSPKSALSVYNLVSTSTKDIVNTSDLVSEVSVAIKVANFPISEQIVNTNMQTTQGVGSLLDNHQFLILSVWFIITVSLIIAVIVKNMYFNKQMELYSLPSNNKLQKICSECKNKMNIRKDIPVLLTDVVEIPSIYGVFKTKILLPSNIDSLLDDTKLKYVLMHELAHHKRRDLLLFWILAILKSIYWFNPLVWLGFKVMKNDCEICCDTVALNYISEDKKIQYGKTILSLISKSMETKNIGIVEGTIGTKYSLKRRIKMIAKFRKNAVKATFATVMIVGVLGVMFLTSAKGEVKNSEYEKDIPKKGFFSLVLEQNENKNIDMCWPLPTEFNRITGRFGERIHPIIKQKRFHSGIDIRAIKGTNIISVRAGIVERADFYGTYGNMVVIDHGNGIKTLYAHCDKLFVKEGQKVNKQQKIATVGVTGKANGPHLHFEVIENNLKVNPLGKEYLKKYISIYN
ncbi:M23/M56 family metallopeptidase [Clostridiaceae bacterium M8S5]|nr:M23/M56 family metallopeptidase [Clostridiaceae bacterium M8S5]